MIMPVNIDADIRNADWTKRSNDLPRITTRAQLVALIRDIPHWLRDLPSANPEAVHQVWHLLTAEERRVYEDRTLEDGHRLIGLAASDDSSLTDNGSAVLSLLAERNEPKLYRSRIASAVLDAFRSAADRFAADADVDAIERGLTGLTDDLLAGLKSDYLPAVEQIVAYHEIEAAAALEVARGRSLAEVRNAARRTVPASVAAARRYALNRALKLVEDLSATARASARAILSRDDLQQATRVRRLRAVIGLNDRQSDSFMRALTEMESARGTTVQLGGYGSVRVPTDGLTSAQLHAAADRYAAYLLDQRASLIAKTEGVTIREETRRNLWEREEAGARFKWVLLGASCPQCTELEGTTVGVGERYAAGIMTPPAHPGCDCTQAVLL